MASRFGEKLHDEIFVSETYHEWWCDIVPDAVAEQLDGEVTTAIFHRLEAQSDFIQGKVYESLRRTFRG